MPIESSDAIRRSMNHYPEGGAELGRGYISSYNGTKKKKKKKKNRIQEVMKREKDGGDRGRGNLQPDNVLVWEISGHHGDEIDCIICSVAVWHKALLDVGIPNNIGPVIAPQVALSTATSVHVANSKRDCECFGHSNRCSYIELLNTVICVSCKHNTRGQHCQLCKLGYYRNTSAELDDENVCIGAFVSPEGGSLTSNKSSERNVAGKLHRQSEVPRKCTCHIHEMASRVAAETCHKALRVTEALPCAKVAVTLPLSRCPPPILSHGVTSLLLLDPRGPLGCSHVQPAQPQKSVIAVMAQDCVYVRRALQGLSVSSVYPAICGTMAANVTRVCDNELLRCQNGGVCVNNVRCSCPSDYSGLLCEKPRCESELGGCGGPNSGQAPLTPPSSPRLLLLLLLLGTALRREASCWPAGL
ncbi:hypothetical protein FQN60_013908 [Etheostoma spectabile]|uniref:EGF-like domain-containing protein n=1 Tax=Etheostoma spectabile TaxID=54343 RepID=A0A5J5CKW4_9PERO|nr:hypothetical protein FQN60_013908 [Etheostoma spectabile]